MINKTKQGKSNYKSGIIAELYAECVLRLKGYKILENRYKTKLGEIDIIAKKSNTLIFIEVKKRKSLNEALASITPKMKKRITNTANIYISKHNKNYQYGIRIDLFAVSGLKFAHIKNI